MEANTPTARARHAMAATPSTATPSGVLLFGGYDGNYYLGDTWLFNTATSTWTQPTITTSTPTKRNFHAMATTPSGVLLFGGYNNVSNYLGDTWLFDTTTGSWTSKTASPANATNTPSARSRHAMAATPSGDVLLFGGYVSGTNTTYFNDTWLFDTTTGSWTSKTASPANATNTPSARYLHAMAATPSGVLLFGGYGSSGYLSDTWFFNTVTNTWGQVITSSAPTARSRHAMAATPSGVLLFGGFNNTLTPSNLNDTWTLTLAYNGSTWTGTWTDVTASSIDITNTPSARGYHAMAATPSGALLFGGYYGVSGDHYLDDTWLYGPTESTPTISVTSPTAGATWTVGQTASITWTSTGLNTNTLTILLARNGVHFTETITHGLAYNVHQHTWTVTGPGTINAKIRVQQDATEGTSPAFFTIADAYPYTGTTITTSDPVLVISGGSGPGTLWVTPLTPTNTSDPDLGRFIQETGQRSALFFDIRQQGLSGTLTIVLHYTPQLGEETFVLYRWNGTGWVNMPGIPPSPNLVDHTFTITINATDLDGTPFGLGGNPAAMPGLSPWALALLSFALLGAGGWWFMRRRRLA
ncbi:MAG: IPTL-CTERM sorting domain-containing protein [Coprothermobacterota bacterium]|nr:IPTL-CTERM sorting domain-containing protein [Coprothermobacterota bacterium]